MEVNSKDKTSDKKPKISQINRSRRFARAIVVYNPLFNYNIIPLQLERVLNHFRSWIFFIEYAMIKTEHRVEVAVSDETA